MQSALSHFDSLDRSNGNGSRSAEEDWLDDNTTASENQWSTAATTFYISDAPAHRQAHFESLYEIHNGWGEADRRGSIRHSHLINDAETFCNILELPGYQRRRVLYVAENLDFSSKRFGGKSYEKILLAVCSLVSDEELSSRLQQNGASGDALQRQRLILQDQFRDLMDANGLGSREHSRIRQMLREKTQFFD